MTILLSPEPDRLPGDGRIVVGFSGGPDSLCLLHQLAASGTRRSLLAIHIDHGLDAESAGRADRAKALANDLEVDCRVVPVEVGSEDGPEAAARSARYAAFGQHLQPGDVLLTAHHADDQAETVLLRLLRGAGPTGLAGMPRVRRFGDGWLVRPLLGWKRNDIENYLAEHQLEPVRDPANEQLNFDRNFLRHRVFPLLHQQWPGARRALLRSARLNAGASEALEALADNDLATCTAGPRRLYHEPFSSLPPFRRCELLRHWCHQAGLSAPPGRRLEAFIPQLVEADRDRTPELRWNDGVIRRWGGFLWLDPLPEPPRHWRVPWSRGSQLTLPDGLGKLELAGAAEWPPDLEVTAGRPGERLRLPGRNGHHRVKQLLAEHDVPPWQRDLWPRLWRNDQLVAVGDRWLDDDFMRELHEDGLELIWHRNLP